MIVNYLAQLSVRLPFAVAADDVDAGGHAQAAAPAQCFRREARGGPSSPL